MAKNSGALCLMYLIYLSPVPWRSFAQRPHKFVEWFHKRTGRQVLWVEPYPTRFPQLNDFRRIVPAKKLDFAPVPSWLQIFNPIALPIEPLPGSGYLNSLLWASLIRKLKALVSEQEVLLVVGKPSDLALQVLEAVSPYQSIYDAMDDFPAFHSGLSRQGMARRELSLVHHVSKVWVSSTALRERWQREGVDVCFVPNALDGGLLPLPRLITGENKRKIFGYVGTIGNWFDWEWVFGLAKLRPGDIVRLIGPVLHPAQFVLPKNVEMLPPCHHEAALLAMSEFDVGLIPFKKNELTVSVDPIKFYEYRALGLPVISTDFGEMQFRANEAGTFISKAFSDIGRIAAIAIEFKDCSGTRGEFAMRNTWEARFDGAGLLP